MAPPQSSSIIVALCDCQGLLLCGNVSTKVDHRFAHEREHWIWRSTNNRASQQPLPFPRGEFFLQSRDAYSNCLQFDDTDLRNAHAATRLIFWNRSAWDLLQTIMEQPISIMGNAVRLQKRIIAKVRISCDPECVPSGK